eukprot:252411-Ditylum_brightwellii.AAC.1
MGIPKLLPNSLLCELEDLDDVNVGPSSTASLSDSTTNVLGEQDNTTATELPNYEFCCTLDANSYCVHGKIYKSKKKQVEVGPSLFWYFAAGIIKTNKYH